MSGSRRAAAVRQPASIAVGESRHAAAVRFSWLEDRIDPAGIGGPNSCGSRSIATAAAADAKRERVGWVGKGGGLSVSDTTCYTPGRRRSPGRERDTVNIADDGEQRNSSGSRTFSIKSKSVSLTRNGGT